MNNTCGGILIPKRIRKVNRRPKIGEDRIIEYTRTSISITKELLKVVDDKAEGNRSYCIEKLLRKALGMEELKI